MSDLTASTEAPAPDPAPQPAPEPQPAPAPAPESPPAPEPAPAPEGQQPPIYPVDEPQREHVAKTIWNGEEVSLTQDELNRLAHVGFSYLSHQQQQSQQPQQPQQQSQPQPEDEMTLLRKELAQVRQELNSTNYNIQLQGETKRINEGVDAEMPKHKVFTDNLELQPIIRQTIMSTLSHNPRMTEEAATKQVMNSFGAAINKNREAWISGKVGDAQNAEVPPGGQPAGTPKPEKLTGSDLMKGRVRDAALRRLGNKEIITQ